MPPERAFERMVEQDTVSEFTVREHQIVLEVDG